MPYPFAMKSQDRKEDVFMEDVFLQDSLCPTIAEHATQCNSLFHRYMLAPEIVPDPTVVDDELARFTLWTSNMDVYGPLNISLDYRLRFSPTVVEIIHQLLDVICDTLTSLKPINESPPNLSRKRQRLSEHGNGEVRKRFDDDASDSDGDTNQAEVNISKITDTIGGTVTRLFRLSNAIRKSAKANRARKIERYRDDEEANRAIVELRLYTECYIRFRFPMASDSLCSALIEANVLRLRRLYYQQAHRRRIGLTAQNPPTAPTIVELPKMKGSAPAVKFTSGGMSKQVSVDRTSGPVGLSPVPVTNATTARQTAVGPLYAKSTTEVPRAKSVLVNNKLFFPPIPPTPECPYCGVIIEFKSAARNHVIGDLEPFICVFPHCLRAGQNGTSPLTFETSKAWIGHIQNAHGYVWECRAPSHDPIIFDEEAQYQDHSVREHDVPETHVETLSSAARRPVMDKILECPFGDDFQHPETFDSSSGFSSEALQTHVAAHLKEIALLTLQKLPDDLGEDTENVDSDQPLEDDAPGFAKLRGSMYSVLDDESLDFETENEAAEGVPIDDEDDIGPSVTRLDLEDKDDEGMTKLHHAVYAGDLSLAQSLVYGDANLLSRDNGGRTALHYASMSPARRPEMMTLLLNAGGESIMNLGNDNGQTALHYAAKRNFADGIRTLVKYGADLHNTDKYGFSPLLWAVVNDQTGATEQLLTLGADSNSTSADGKSALAWATSLHSVSITRLLITHGASIFNTQGTQRAPLADAAASGALSIMQLLLSSGSDPNQRDHDGWSALHFAAEERHLEVVRSLLLNGADIDAISAYGTSPLHCAANGGHLDIVSLLIERGADCLKSTCHGWTALHHAAYNGHSHIVEYILKRDSTTAVASQQDNHGWSVLHLAVHSRDLATVNALLGNSTAAELRTLVDESGLTAEEWLDLEANSRSYKVNSNLAFSKSRCCRTVTGLRQAVVSGIVPMVELLLKWGHSVDGVDSGRRTALYYAVKNRILPIMDLLLDAGANTNILPAGRRSWEEFVSDHNVLLRLKQAGYRKPGPEPEIERSIRLALRAHSQPSALGQWASSIPDTSSSVPDSSVSGAVSTRSLAPTARTYDQKRKIDSIRSKGFWKRWL